MTRLSRSSSPPPSARLIISHARERRRATTTTTAMSGAAVSRATSPSTVGGGDELRAVGSAPSADVVGSGRQATGVFGVQTAAPSRGTIAAVAAAAAAAAVAAVFSHALAHLRDNEHAPRRCIISLTSLALRVNAAAARSAARPATSHGSAADARRRATLIGLNAATRLHVEQVRSYASSSRIATGVSRALERRRHRRRRRRRCGRRCR